LAQNRSVITTLFLVTRIQDLRNVSDAQKTSIISTLQGLITSLTNLDTQINSSDLSSTTSSAIALSVIITCSIIAIGVLIFLLALADVMSKSDSHTAATRRLQMVAALIPEWRDSSSAQRTAALQVIYVPLIVTFCAFVVFAVARLV